MKALVQMSENKEESKSSAVQEHLRSIDAEFENYIPHLVDMTKNT
jgi:hypothetical protein